MDCSWMLGGVLEVWEGRKCLEGVKERSKRSNQKSI